MFEIFNCFRGNAKVLILSVWLLLNYYKLKFEDDMVLVLVYLW